MALTFKSYILTILIFVLPFHLGFSTASKNLWDTIGDVAGITGTEDPQKYEEKLCSLDSIDCYNIFPCSNFTENEEQCKNVPNCTFVCGICQDIGNVSFNTCPPCENFNYNTGACRQQINCWYSCKQKRCVDIDDFDETETCSQFCNSKCDCWGKAECHYHDVNAHYLQKWGYSKLIAKGCYRNSDTIPCDELMAQHFGDEDCVRGSANNTFYFLNGVLCSSKSEDDSENCEVEEVLDNGYTLAAPIYGEGRFEYKMTIQKIPWETGDTQLYQGFLAGASIPVRLTKEQLQDKADERINVLFNFYTRRFPISPGFQDELGLVDIAGVGNGALKRFDSDPDATSLFIGDQLPGCANVGKSDNYVSGRRTVRFKN